MLLKMIVPLLFLFLTFISSSFGKRFCCFKKKNVINMTHCADGSYNLMRCNSTLLDRDIIPHYIDMTGATEVLVMNHSFRHIESPKKLIILCIINLINRFCLYQFMENEFICGIDFFGVLRYHYDTLHNRVCNNFCYSNVEKNGELRPISLVCTNVVGPALEHQKYIITQWEKISSTCILLSGFSATFFFLMLVMYCTRIPAQCQDTERKCMAHYCLSKGLLHIVAIIRMVDVQQNRIHPFLCVFVGCLTVFSVLSSCAWTLIVIFIKWRSARFEINQGPPQTSFKHEIIYVTFGYIGALYFTTKSLFESRNNNFMDICFNGRGNVDLAYEISFEPACVYMLISVTYFINSVCWVESKYKMVSNERGLVYMGHQCLLFLKLYMISSMPWVVFLGLYKVFNVKCPFVAGPLAVLSCGEGIILYSIQILIQSKAFGYIWYNEDEQKLHENNQETCSCPRNKLPQSIQHITHTEEICIRTI